MWTFVRMALSIRQNEHVVLGRPAMDGHRLRVALAKLCRNKSSNLVQQQSPSRRKTLLIYISVGEKPAYYSLWLNSTTDIQKAVQSYICCIRSERSDQLFRKWSSQHQSTVQNILSAYETTCHQPDVIWYIWYSSTHKMMLSVINDYHRALLLVSLHWLSQHINCYQTLTTSVNAQV